ncbi:DUF4268 domain-containing protein [Bifidobacterium polysaccharolyticum]|uniref:DUF4268 domain-containing protein n=1 Tax=Bifidobacterium polysaccharolyticum TaxID=2750967 RepID=UPI0021BA839B|nr:DUF4268 domain-containing protein [Bifidobacterium polysaccharolyticum]
MNAGPILLLSLIADMSKRFVVPVYQRPYSWEEEQCEQLWNDVLTVGRHAQGTHFTGSVVWIQDGTMGADGMTSAFIIDGQQRITTVNLLLAALADYSRNHGNQANGLQFSYEELIGTGYLVNPYRKGEGHYRLCLSQGDHDTYKSIIDHLEDPRVQITEESRRLVDNLKWFRDRLANLEDPNSVWAGLRRLEVVSISLTQGQDNPQVIFESMNSTGKDLSTADLVRNYVLMGQSIEAQEGLYQHHWRKIEEALGVDRYDDVFDDFLYDWLAVINAPRPVVAKKVYRFFKEYVTENGYGEGDQIIELIDQMCKFAGYYSLITANSEGDSEVNQLLNRIEALNITVTNPLLMALLDDYQEGDSFLSRDDLLHMLKLVESYLFRRIVCRISSTGLNKFFLSVIASLRRIRDDGSSDYRQAFEAALLGNGETSHRMMPDDRQFKEALLSRDFYPFTRCYYMLATLENRHHPKDPIDFSSGNYTIEHILPQNALARKEWRQMLGPDCEKIFPDHINKLGNLTLTAYNSELSDASFEEKKHRIIGGYENEYLTISSELHEAKTWDAQSIDARTDRLVKEALEVWPKPKIDPATIDKYKSDRQESIPAKTVTLRMLGASGLLKPGDRLGSLSRKYEANAVITEKMLIRVSNGHEFDSPSPAASYVLKLAGASSSSINGWKFWGREGTSLDDFRSRYLVSKGDMDSLDRSTVRAMFWDGFADFCAARDEFTAAFGSAFAKADHTRYYLSFGSSIPGCNLSALIGMRDKYTTVEFLFHDPAQYANFLEYKSKVESDFSSREGDLDWDDKDVDKKSRHLTLTRRTDYKQDQWDDIYRWLADALLKMKSVSKYVR